MSVHIKSLKGLRKSNEDRHKVIINMNLKESSNAPINFYGVYDGHGGKYVSKFLSDYIHNFFTDHNVKYPLEKEYVDQVYKGLQYILYTDHVKESTNCGSTCLIALEFKHNGKRMLNVVNTGDSRGVICRYKVAVPLTLDHKPYYPDEKRRIEKLGGKIRFDGHDWRIDDLSVSRAFGDKSSEKYITNKPDMYLYHLTDRDWFMILGCDGLWDVLDNQEAVNFVLEKCYDIDYNRNTIYNTNTIYNPNTIHNPNTINKPNKNGQGNIENNIASELASLAIKRGSSDNVTVIVVFF